jgi:hypothetical protein
VEDISKTPCPDYIYGRRDANKSAAAERACDEKLMLFPAISVKSVPKIFVQDDRKLRNLRLQLKVGHRPALVFGCVTRVRQRSVRLRRAPAAPFEVCIA